MKRLPGRFDSSSQEALRGSLFDVSVAFVCCLIVAMVAPRAPWITFAMSVLVLLVVLAVIWYRARLGLRRVEDHMLLKDRRRKRYRLEHQLCVVCGHDLRGTPDRCAECGAIPSSTAPSEEGRC